MAFYKNDKIETFCFRWHGIASKSVMEFPITRQELQQYNTPLVELVQFNSGAKMLEDAYQVQFDASIDTMVQELCEQFEDNRLQAYKEQQFIYRPVLRKLEAIVVRNDNGIVMPNEQKQIVMKALVEKVRPLFVDCNVVISPLNTSIIVDWSEPPPYSKRMFD
jgi:alpha-mannosidase